MFKESKWISAIMEDWDFSFLFRKEFSVTKEIETAKLNICMLGFGICTINGKNITDNVLTTPFTNFDIRTYYNTYDVTKLLNVGENAIGVHLGNGFYNNDDKGMWNFDTARWRGAPKVIAELIIKYKDGNIQMINTDKTWRASEGNLRYNQVRQGEIFDFNLIKCGFDLPGFCDSDWKIPVIVEGPGGILEESIGEPIRVIRTLEPKKITDDIYDFGENISGWVRILGTGEKYQEMKIEYDEALNAEKSDLLGYVNSFNKRHNTRLHHTDIVIFSGEENEEYAPSFLYHGFRYVKIINAPKNLKMVAEVVHSDLKQLGSFKCSDKMLNKIHEASVRSTLTNFHGIPEDCPQREQNGWTGDAQVSCEQTSINFDMLKSYKKWLIDVTDNQRPSGQMSAISPTSWQWAYRGASGPAWDAALFVIPWQMYEIYGDTSLLAMVYENMERYLDFLHTMSDNYIVDMGLGDWCPPKPQVYGCPRDVTATAYYYYDAVIMMKASKLLDKPYEKWEGLAKNIKKAWREVFLVKKELYSSQTFLACAIYHDLLESKEKTEFSAMLNQLVIDNDYHTDCGILGQKFIFSALSDFGYEQTVYKMITNPTMPSYAYWINNGATTFCEKWDMSTSQNHHMFSSVDEWFYKYVGGLKFDGGKITVNPSYIEEIDEVEVHFKDLCVKRNGKEVEIYRRGN